jgi:hypothetical protein
MMFALLQEQHKAQMDAMAAANQKAMELMMEKMNALVAGAQKGQDKENAPPTGNSNQGNGGTKCFKKKCQYCGKHVFHKAADCYELEANASKRWAGWKLVKETGKTTA